MQWLAAFCARSCFCQDCWELWHRLPQEQLRATHVYLRLSLTGARGRTGLEGDSSWLRKPVWIDVCFLICCFQSLHRPLVASMPCDCHCWAPVSTRLFWPKAFAQMHLYQHSCAHAALEKTWINLTSSFILFLTHAASTAPSAQLSWFNCIDMKPLLCQLERRPQRIPDWQCTGKNTWALKNTCFVLGLAFAFLFPFLETMTAPVIKIQFLVKKLYKASLVPESCLLHTVKVRSWSLLLYSADPPQLWQKIKIKK